MMLLILQIIQRIDMLQFCLVRSIQITWIHLLLLYIVNISRPRLYAGRGASDYINANFVDVSTFPVKIIVACFL